MYFLKYIYIYTTWVFVHFTMGSIQLLSYNNTEYNISFFKCSTWPSTIGYIETNSYSCFYLKKWMDIVTDHLKKYVWIVKIILKVFECFNQNKELDHLN